MLEVGLLSGVADLVEIIFNFPSHRFTEEMDIILSPSFFVQFGCSGIVFCSSTYLLSTVSTGIGLCFPRVHAFKWPVSFDLADHFDGRFHQIHRRHALFDG